MDAIYINLDRAGDRRAFVEGQAERLGLPLERFAAVSAEAIDEARLAALGRSWERPLSRPELGCFLSHHGVWERIASSGRPALVMEDDVRLSPRLPVFLPMIGALSDCDLVNLEDFARRRFVARQSLPLGEGLRRVRVFRDKAGAAAYVLWPRGAERLLARARRQGAAPADAFLHSARLRAYQCEPALAIQAEVLARRGGDAGFLPPTSIQAPRRRLAPTAENLPFLARRFAAQVRLLPFHAGRLFGLVYRRIDIDTGDFPPASDQSRS